MSHLLAQGLSKASELGEPRSLGDAPALAERVMILRPRRICVRAWLQPELLE
jgi:hypothetical protein